MRDQISFKRAQLLHPIIRDEVVRLVEEAEKLLPANCAVRLAQTLRTEAEQNALYAQGRTKPGKIVTNAKFGASFHCYGLAIDFCLVYDLDGNGTYEFLSWDIKADKDNDKIADWMEVVMVFKNAGYKWGGDFKSITDNPHLEKTFGYTWRQLYKKYLNKDFITISGTQYVTL
jgi:peptidoglycan L-alanyl-D-glutamate endopeptidase CwlK